MPALVRCPKCENATKYKIIQDLSAHFFNSKMDDNDPQPNQCFQITCYK